MKYRTKLFICFLAVALVSVCLSVGTFYHFSRKALFNEVRDQVRSLVVTAAALIDWKGHSQLLEVQDMKGPIYKSIRNQMEKFVSVNQGHGIDIRYAYTLRPVIGDPKLLEFVIDTDNASTRQKIGSRVTDVFEVNILEHNRNPYVMDHFVKSPWGHALSAYAPIVDEKGNYIATLGIDVYEKQVNPVLNRLIWYSLLALGVGILLSVIVAYWLSHRVTYSLNQFIRSAREIGHGNFDAKIQIKSNDEFGQLAHSLEKMEIDLKEREHLIANFSSYVSDHVLEKMIESDEEIPLHGERRKVTILSSDFKQLAKLSEKSDPAHVVSILNLYFEQLIKVMFKHNGTLNKFSADGVLIIFGAPLQDGAQEDNALKMAIDLQKMAQQLSEEHKLKERLNIAIGIHTGDAVVGSVGGKFMAQYTAIGSVVEIANHLRSESKADHRGILITNETKNGLAKEYPFEKVDHQVDNHTLYQLKNN